MSDSLSSNVIVAVRVRPPGAGEQGCDPERPIIRHLAGGCIAFDPPYASADALDTTISIPGRASRPMPGQKRSKNLDYRFDRVFDQDATQAEVYEATAKKVIDKVTCGFNACVFAYGATGSGKTHTMLGADGQPGVMVRTVDDLFAAIHSLQSACGTYTYEVSLSYLEVYQEMIRDLLRDDSGPLQLHEDKSGLMSVKGLTEQRGLKSTGQVFQLLRQGNHRRSQCATDQNQQSSRSHAVLQIVVKKLGGGAELWTSKLSLIDLAGSERAAASTNQGRILKEGASINTSLLALGNVINALATRAKMSKPAAPTTARGKAHTPAPSSRNTLAPSTSRPRTASAASANQCHIPYRGSKLTRLLKDSLGGRCMTVMIAAVSPSSLSREDTHNTLKYANRAKQIKVEARVNVTGAGGARLGANAAAMMEQVKILQTQVANLTRENAELRQRERSATTTAASNGSRQDPAADAAAESYQHRLDTLYDAKDAADVEWNRLRCATLSLNVTHSLVARMATEYAAGPDKDSVPSQTQHRLATRAAQLDAQRRSHTAQQRQVQSAQVEPIVRQLAALRREIEHDPRLNQDRSALLRMAMDARAANRSVQEKAEMIDTYSELVSTVSSRAHLSSQSLMKLLSYVRVNTGVAPDATLFTPSLRPAHARFVDGVQMIADEGLDVEERTEGADEEQAASHGFVVEAIAIGGVASRAVESTDAHSDQADQVSSPEPPYTYATYARAASAARHGATPLVTPSKFAPQPTLANQPPTACQTPTSAAASAAPSATSTPLQSAPVAATPHRRSGRGSRSSRKSRAREAREGLSMTPLVRSTAAGLLTPNGTLVTDEDDSQPHATPETTPKPLSYAAVISIAANSPIPLPLPSPPRAATTPLIARGGRQPKEMFSPAVRSNAATGRLVSPPHPSASPRPESSPPARRFAKGGHGGLASSVPNIRDQLNQWTAELSQLTVMQADTNNAARLHRRQNSRLEGDVAASTSFPAIGTTAAALHTTATAATNHVTAASPASATTSGSASIKSLRARLQGMNRPATTAQLPPVAAPRATPTSALLRRPPLPKSAAVSVVAPSAPKLLSKSVVTPSAALLQLQNQMDELENAIAEEPAMQPMTSRPLTAPLTVRTDTFASHHNQRGSLAPNGVAPGHFAPSGKAKLLSLNLAAAAAGSPSGKISLIPQVSPREKRPQTLLAQRPLTAHTASPASRR